jgi:2-polyprenyl-6-methoxyphenol hydroxylase-like FAD-dependent oxidoreductase
MLGTAPNSAKRSTALSRTICRTSQVHCDFPRRPADLVCPQLVFNRTTLMGDASFVIRPHTAASTSKGIANAFALVGELAGKQELAESLDHWQRSEFESRPATDELWARSRQVARALNNQKKREIDPTAPAFPTPAMHSVASPIYNKSPLDF